MTNVANITEAEAWCTADFKAELLSYVVLMADFVMCDVL